MILTDIAIMRLRHQQISNSQFESVKQLVSWMGAMQAQDFTMARWAIGLRIPNATNQTIEKAYNKGEIIRTHILRPTWHLVAADDLHWMLELTAPHIQPSFKSRHSELGLSETILKKCNLLMEKILRDDNYLTREELILEFEKEKIATSDNRASHIFAQAELNGLICSGPMKKGKPTYALLGERVPKKTSLTREEALENLARKYFTSHGPATLQDFGWWSGLSVGNTKQAFEMIKKDFTSVIINSQTYWVSDFSTQPKPIKEKSHLLPAFDEFIISYKDRTASVPFEDHKKAVSNNGIFWPTIVVDGQVLGTWKRTIKKETILIETKFFKKLDKKLLTSIEKAALQYAEFLEKKFEIKHAQ